MDKDLLNIKLMVADRLYPLSIDPSEEESFRLAAKKINEMIQTFERHYDLRDKQDAIAMCAIVLARQASQEKLNEDDKQEQITKKLQDIYAVLNSIA
ncbi:cell division protein ZapA [Capnocytophaga leadbetteri]|uniref:cell division protein ZapA n=1 Tax=Capnocytophaga leadbetteri TaxID=327575 RepID=UPI0028E7CF29|nr:cell division protein ZapA [Capnocytophaga leadbetteri]